jgi:hypothetical protein
MYYDIKMKNSKLGDSLPHPFDQSPGLAGAAEVGDALVGPHPCKFRRSSLLFVV